MTPIPDHHRISTGIREVASPETVSAYAANEGPETITLSCDHEQVLAVVSHILDRTEEVKALIGIEPLKDLERTLQILEDM